MVNIKSDLGIQQAHIEDYDEAITDPLCDAVQQIGTAKSKLGDKKARYNKAIELDPKMEMAYNNRVNARLASGDTKGALEDFNKAIESNPNLLPATSTVRTSRNRQAP
ncbi:MAG: hypothetical protein R3B51_11490 [Thermodesulfobacteriota bacterium]